MSLTAAAHRLVATLAAMLQTRLELVTIELEEEVWRYARYFILALAALFCAGVAISLTVLLLIALFWDEHRLAVLFSLIGGFGLVSLLLAVRLRLLLQHKPRLLQQSLQEFRQDAGLLHPTDTSQELR